jgi:uncharacterized membrane protein YkoI
VDRKRFVSLQAVLSIMRFVLILIAILFTTMPVLAEKGGQGRGNGHGNGQQQSDSSGKEQGRGSGKGGGNGQNNGNGNGQGNGNDRGSGQGNGNSHGQGASDQNNGNGNQNSGNGQGSENGSDKKESPATSEQPSSTADPIDEETAIHQTPDVARDAVNAGQAVSLGSLLPDLEARKAGDVIDAELLEVQGFLVYAVKVLRGDGQVTTEYYYAQSGRFIGSEP